MDANAPVVVLSEEERLERRAKIAALEEHMRGMPPEEQIAPDDMTRHHFGSGVYCREAFLPAGSLVVGKIHRTCHIAVLLSGSVRILTEHGSIDYEAPKVMVAPAGIKRVAFALKDSVWLAFHAVGDERDLSAIEERFIAKDFDDPALPQVEQPQITEVSE